MQKLPLEIIGMKPTKLTILFSIFLCNIIFSTEIIETYFENVYLDEKNKFLKCVEEENLDGINKVNTKCRVSKRIEKSAYILYEKEQIYKEDLLDSFKRFSKTDKSKAIRANYPRSMQERGVMGFVLLNFDIDKDGNTKNIEVLDGKCGNMYSPFTTFDQCNSFNSSAKQYMKKVTYNPTTFEGKEIYSMNNKHSISFFLDGEEPLNIMNLSDYRKLIDHINNERLIKASEIAKKNYEKENIFLFQLARINYLNKNFEEAEYYFQSFIKKAEANNDEIPEGILTSTASLMIESMFNQGKYDEIIKMSSNIDTYLKNRKKFSEVIGITHLYIGISLLNTGNVEDGIYYLISSKRKIENEGQIAFINNVLNSASNYL